MKTAEDIALEALYEDDELLAINKPAGMVVHPTYKNAEGTLLNALLWRARDWPTDCRPSIVGRLDKQTSGLVVVAKTAAVHAMLQRTLATGDSEKDYLAVVYGIVSDASGEIDLRLCHDPKDRRMIVAIASGGGAPRAAKEDGAQSLTQFERLATVDAPRAGLSLLRCRLVTGRRHQIRVHLQARGWPIVGDQQYGEPRWTGVDDPALAAALQAFPRQALHAWRVAFTHPVRRERMTIEARPPQDFTDLLTASGLPRV